MQCVRDQCRREPQAQNNYLLNTHHVKYDLESSFCHYDLRHLLKQTKPLVYIILYFFIVFDKIYIANVAYFSTFST